MVATLKFIGSNCFRQRLILSLLTGKSVIIDLIRPDDGGIREFEVNLLQLIEKITNGSRVTNNGQRVHFTPGTIIGGDIIHFCHTDRSISYYLEVLLALAPFCKKPLQAQLKGVTNDQIDPSVDALKASALPLIRRFIGETEGTKLDIKVNARGFKPEGGGEIVFTCPVIRQLKPVQLTKPGKIKRIRGIAVAARVSPQMANRIIDTSKGLCLNFIPDIYIYSDHNKGKSSGLSPGFCISLSAETIDGCFYTASAVSNPKGSPNGPSIPEDVGREAANTLFEEIARGGCVDSISQSLALTFMAFNQKDISQIKFGSLTMYTIHYLRHLKEFCSLTFRLEPTDDNEVLATCEGIGFKNLSRPTY